MLAALAACFFLPLFGPSASSLAQESSEIMVTWQDETGTEQSTFLQPEPEEEEITYSLSIAAVTLPPVLTVSETATSEEGGETVWIPVETELLGQGEDGAYIYLWTAGGQEESRTETLHVYLNTETHEETVPEEVAAPVETPSASVNIIVHYQTSDGEMIAEDESFMGLKGTTVPVYAKQLDDGWTIVSDPLQYVDVPADAPDTLETAFIYTKPTPTPAPPEVKVTVHYRDVGGVPVASDTVVVCPGGSVEEISAAPKDLKPDYYPTSESVQQVATNTEGTPQEIIFFYTYRAPATPAPANVLIRYVDAAGQPVAQDSQIAGTPGQEMTVYAAPEQLMDYYVLDDDESKIIVLPDSGETVSVTFQYRLDMPQTEAPTATPEPEATATPQPARIVGFVQVSYVYQGNSSLDYSEPVTIYEGQTELNGGEGQRTGYRLISPETVLVTLDSEGQANPNQVTFVYAPENSEPVMPELIVQYFAEDGTQIATSTLMTLHFGENTVYASPVDLAEGYDQITPSFTVTVDDQGHADVDIVTFYYKQSKGGTGADSYQVIPARGYARAKNDSVNLRSTPSTGSDSNIIGKISKTDIIEIKGTATAGGKWYYVSVNERQGYVSASVVTELSDADVEVLLGIGETEGQEADDGMIERWAQVKKKVWFRSEPNGKKIKELKKSTRVFVDEIIDNDGTLWCHVRYNGKEGYIMSEFLDIYSAAESHNLQLSLPSPVPTHTSPATRVPTSTPTAFIPTATPTLPPVTPEPVMTATPLPYSGYAVTSMRAVIRGGLSTDYPALITLNGETLVMVQGQTYVNDICWDSVRVVSNGITGFVEDDKLFHVTNEVAEDYLEDLTTPTPAATPDNTPMPFTGYAVILMDGVPLRQQMNSNAQYISVLYEGTVVSVLRQSTAEDGLSWCLVQSGMYLGYVRRDMLRQMMDIEIANYLEANHSKPTATPAVTATPRAQSAMASCWGIIKPDRANLRSEPSLSRGTSLRLMSKNEFVQVQGSFLGDDEQVWQQVMIGGIVGYMRADYIQILTQGELTSVVTSDEFKSANTTETTVTGADSIQSYETYLANQRSYPSLTASFEPFNPYTTPAAVISAATDTPATPSVTMPPTPEATIIMNPDRTPPPNAAGGINFGAVFAGAGILALAGGAVFVWQAYHGKKRRQAMQRAQAIRRRQQAEPQDTAGERHERTYRRDAPVGYAREGHARPNPTEYRGAGDEGEYVPPVTRAVKTTEPENERTQQFRRPEQPTKLNVKSVQTNITESVSGVPEIKEETQTSPAANARRRRTERNHYDEDGN